MVVALANSDAQDLVRSAFNGIASIIIFTGSRCGKPTRSRSGSRETFVAMTTQRKSVADSVGYEAFYRQVYGGHQGVSMRLTKPVGPSDYDRYQMSPITLNTTIRAETAVSPCSINKPTYVQELSRTVYDDISTDNTRQTISLEPAFKHKRGQVAYSQILTLDRSVCPFYNNLEQHKLAQFNPFIPLSN